MLSALLEYMFVVLTCESFLPFLARMRGNATFVVLNLEGVLVSNFAPYFSYGASCTSLVLFAWMDTSKSKITLVLFI